MKIQQDALGKVIRVKDIKRREKDDLKITDNSIMWGRTCHGLTSWKCEVKGRVCEVSLGQRRGSSYGKGGRGMRRLRATSHILGPPGIGFSLSCLKWMLWRIFVKGTVSMLQIREKYIVSITLFNIRVLVTEIYSFDLTVKIQLSQ